MPCRNEEQLISWAFYTNSYLILVDENNAWKCRRVIVKRRSVHHDPSPRNGPVHDFNAFDARGGAKDRLVVLGQLAGVEQLAGEQTAGEQPQ